MAHIEKKQGGKLVYDGKVIKLHVDDVLLEDGSPAKREYITHQGGACVLAIVDGGILFVEQYRYPYGESVYEIPAGKLDLGEAHIKAAARELEEEGGIIADELELLYVYYPSPGYTNEKIYIYQAHGGKKTSAHLDEGEYLDAEFVPLARVREMLKNGELHDGKTIVALQYYLLSIKD